ncbi:5'/3'-nucleotidase SurE [Metabacillus litoralis]|uniref:5'/3'-nucleotidase SurE n=1 Tax=Metabacillus litoralis TaxID=152268 RepID=UPI0020405138|nr:5'/3'-nucleotidase SurE [Metabacillus litoralis]
MKILVTNDDGVFAPGVEIMVEVLQHFGDVYVVCPDQERSAISHSITLRQPLKAKKVGNFPGTKGSWAVNGTTADCVKLALEVLLKDTPDFVFSGINMGPNLGRDLYYSGTIAGAAESSLYQVPSIAVSLDAFHDTTIKAGQVKSLFYEVVEVILQNKIPKGVFLNINLPNIPKELCEGVSIVPLDMELSRYRYVGLNDPHGQVYYWLKDELVSIPYPPETNDYGKLKQGFVTISPITIKTYEKRKIEKIERWFKSFKYKQHS